MAIDMSTGAFTQTGSILVPYAQTYGIDAAIYGVTYELQQLRRCVSERLLVAHKFTTVSE
jgi:hypothetical protein